LFYGVTTALWNPNTRKVLLIPAKIVRAMLGQAEFACAASVSPKASGA
jgi:hypothetical protein